MKKHLSNSLRIQAAFAILDSNGNIINRHALRACDKTMLERFCKRLDSMEIDGVKFTVKADAMDDVRLILKSMRGRKLSDAIVPNYPLKEGAPLSQIIAKKPEAKQTASVLNKFIYRSRKLLIADNAVILIRECVMS